MFDVHDRRGRSCPAGDGRQRLLKHDVAQKLRIALGTQVDDQLARPQIFLQAMAQLGEPLAADEIQHGEIADAFVGRQRGLEVRDLNIVLRQVSSDFLRKFEEKCVAVEW